MRKQTAQTGADRLIFNPAPQEGPTPIGSGTDAPVGFPAGIERAKQIAEEFKTHAGAETDRTLGAAGPQERAARSIYGAELLPEVADAVDRANAIAEQFKRTASAAAVAEPGTRQSEVIGMAGEAAAGVLRHVPDPSRIRDLSESPEKAAVAGAKTAATIAVPQVAPVIGTAANAAEKEVERSQVPDRLP